MLCRDWVMKKEDLIPVWALAFLLAIISIFDQLWSTKTSGISTSMSLLLVASSPLVSRENYYRRRITMLLCLSTILLTSAANFSSDLTEKFLDIAILFICIPLIDYLSRKEESFIPKSSIQNNTSLSVDDLALLGTFAISVSIVTLIESYILPSIITNYVPDGLAFMVILFMGNVILKTATSYRKFIQCCFMTLIVGTTASISAHYTWSQIIAISGSLCLVILLIDFIFDKFKKPVEVLKTNTP